MTLYLYWMQYIKRAPIPWKVWQWVKSCGTLYICSNTQSPHCKVQYINVHNIKHFRSNSPCTFIAENNKTFFAIITFWICPLSGILKLNTTFWALGHWLGLILRDLTMQISLRVGAHATSKTLHYILES